MSGMKGQRQNKQPSTKERVRELEVAMQNTQMALQMSQMMVKHLTEQFQTVQRDLGSTMGMLNDFQYRTLAMLELGEFSTDDIDAKAEDFKLNDFNKASDKEDVVKGFLLDNDGVIGEDSVVILSSKTPDLDEDQGIFRSKFPMSECLTPDLREKMLGSKVGDVIDADIQGIKHVISILGLRSVPVVEDEAELPEDSKEE
jgi:hypothetical protein